MRLASEDVFASAAGKLAGLQERLDGYRADMLAHPVAGWCLRNYLILTEFPELLDEHGLSELERYWSRYYWLSRFTHVWVAIAGDDAGLKQQVFQLWEHAPPDAYAWWPEVEAEAKRAAVEQLRTAAIFPRK